MLSARLCRASTCTETLSATKPVLRSRAREQCCYDGCCALDSDYCSSLSKKPVSSPDNLWSEATASAPSTLQLNAHRHAATGTHTKRPPQSSSPTVASRKTAAQCAAPLPGIHLTNIYKTAWQLPAPATPSLQRMPSAWLRNKCLWLRSTRQVVQRKCCSLADKCCYARAAESRTLQPLAVLLQSKTTPHTTWSQILCLVSP